MPEFVNPHEWEINSTVLKNKIIFPQGTKPKRIFHYTSIHGLQGILEKRTLRFTNINYLNDKDEITAGIEGLAKSIMKELDIPHFGKVPRQAQKEPHSTYKAAPHTRNAGDRLRQLHAL